MATVNRKYFGPRALVAVVKMLLGFDRRIAAAETAVGKAVEDAEARMNESVAAASEATAAATEIAGEAAGGERMRAEAESGREAAESGRVESEEERRRNEQSRLEAERSRAAGEADRIEGELERAANERARVSAESTRESKETARQSAETTRQENETKRVEAEASREQAENERKVAESGRATEFESWKSEIDGKADRSELKEYAKRTEVTQGLDTKQNKLSTTTDLHITDDNTIGLTDMAKKQLFIDLWNEAWGAWGCFDPENAPDPLHPFYGNKLWMTYEEAILVLRSGELETVVSSFSQSGAITNIPNSRPFTGSIATQNWFCVSAIKVARMPTGSWWCGSIENLFAYCSDLVQVINPIILHGGLANRATNVFNTSRLLEDFQIKNLNCDLDLRVCSKLRVSVFSYIVTNTGNTKPITITVHADVYAKLTGDTTNEAAAALTAEELAQWQQVCLDANAKNIAFATE